MKAYFTHRVPWVRAFTKCDTKAEFLSQLQVLLAKHELHCREISPAAFKTALLTANELDLH